MRYNIYSGVNPTEHFTNVELQRASSGNLKDIDANLLPIMDWVRDVANEPVAVNSLIRNYIPAGGAKNSAHLRGNAVDLGMSKQAQAKFKMHLPAFMSLYGGQVGGIGFYSWGVHLDTEVEKATNYWQIKQLPEKDYLLRVWGQNDVFEISDWSPYIYDDSDIEEASDDAHNFNITKIAAILIVAYLFFR